MIFRHPYHNSVLVIAKCDNKSSQTSLCEEHECESNDESGIGVLTCADHVTSVDRNLAVGRLRRDDSAVTTVRRIRES